MTALLLVVLWVGFAASHMLLSSRALRPGLVQRLGEVPFLGAYSLVALAFFVPLCWIYFENRHQDGFFWGAPLGLVPLWATFVLQGLAWVLVVAGLLRPSPGSSLRASASGEAMGVHLLARHPLFVGIGLFGALHLPYNGFGSDIAFFAGFPIFSLLGAWHQDQRKLAAGNPQFRGFVARAPFVPFTGRETLRGLRELSPLAVALGVALTFGLRWLHA